MTPRIATHRTVKGATRAASSAAGAALQAAAARPPVIQITLEFRSSQRVSGGIGMQTPNEDPRPDRSLTLFLLTTEITVG